MCTARTGVPGADIQRAGTERRRNRQFFSIAQLIVGDRGQQGIHTGIRAIGHLLDVYQRMVNKLSEERVTAVLPVVREYVAFWREYPDMFIDFLLEAGNP